MSQTTFAQTKAATCRIECAGSTGTGYLVSGNRIVTCWHVVKDVAVGDSVTVAFPRQELSRAFQTSLCNPVLDAAVLDWRDPIEGIAPLRFGRARERNSVWEGYGYPSLAFGSGLPIDGTIDDLLDKDRDHVDSLVLTADKLAAGLGARPHGFSGSPVVVGGLVVGHLKRILEDDEFGGRVAFGTVFAARAEDFVDGLLPGEPLVDAPSTAPSPLPPVPEDGFDVFLSASPDELARASALVHALRDRSLRVYFPTADYVHGPTFRDAVASALQRSRAAIVMFSPRWLEDAAIETTLLWQRRGPAFPLVPVLPAGGSMPAPWDDFRPIDLRGRGPTGPAFERLLYAIEGRTAPYEVVQADLAQLLKKEDKSEATIANARRLLAIGNPRRALELLTADADDPEMRRLRALALSKSGDTDGAIAILKMLQDQGQLDAETGGILGGCYRRKYDKSKRIEWLELALDAYRAAFDLSEDPYPGINTASILLSLGQTQDASAVARRVVAAVERLPHRQADHWTYGTVAQASLILGDLDAATQAYRRAVRQDIEAIQDIAVMRRGARRVLASRHLPPDTLDPIFHVPRPVAFVGHGLDLPGQRQRFPPSAVGAVRKAINEALDRAGSSLGVASATVGGDTIFLEEVLFKREGTARVLLPCSESQFLESFVVRPDRKYQVRRVLRHPRADVVVVDDPTDPAQVWSDFAPRLSEQAGEWGAALDETPLLLALWDGQSSFLQTVIDQWRWCGWDVDIIEMANGAVQP